MHKPRLTSFWKLASVSKLAKLVHRSVSTIHRWKREGIPEGSKETVRKIITKKRKAGSITTPKRRSHVISLPKRHKKRKAKAQGPPKKTIKEITKLKKQLTELKKEKQRWKDEQWELKDKLRQAELEIAFIPIKRKFIREELMPEAKLWQQYIRDHIPHERTRPRDKVIKYIIEKSLISLERKEKKKKLTEFESVKLKQLRQWQKDIRDNKRFYNSVWISSYIDKNDLNPNLTYRKMYEDYIDDMGFVY